MAEIRDILRQYWSYEYFRPGQEDIIRSVLNKKDTLALLPTGGGKSICFQVPALAINGICLVVSPLIALMNDQVENLKNRNIRAKALTSSLTRNEILQIFSNIKYDGTKFLYVSPERLKSEDFLLNIVNVPISFIAIDEAHCISQWGYDFRPSYLLIKNIRKLFPDKTILALTASATKPVVKDIVEKLELQKPQIFKKSFYRENLNYIVQLEENKAERLLKICQSTNGSIIVYVRNRKKTSEVSQFLNQHQQEATFYHAGLDNNERYVRQELWIRNEKKIMVATNAFGMGIDKPNVRYVVHLDLPDSPEAYFQEAGRAGRDEKKAYAVLLYNESDVLQLEQNFENNFPLVEDIRKVYQSICNYYQIAVGSGEGFSAELDLDKIAEAYKISPIILFNAIRFLEKEGLLSMQDSLYEPSRLHIKAGMNELYDFEVRNEKYEKIIKTLLRSYGGVLDQFVFINENYLAKRTLLSEPEIRQILFKLQELEILEYIPRNNYPKIIFTASRMEAKSVSFSPENYSFIKSRAKERMNTMIDFVRQNELCRNRFLLNYFDEDKFDDCGKCDVCLKHKKQIKRVANSEIEVQIKNLLHHHPLLLEEIVSSLYRIDSKIVIEGVNYLLDDKIIERTETGHLKLIDNG